MHFRLPKPLHGWRALFGEVGIIVVGVLIALGAQQLAQAIQDRARMRESEAALALELGEAVGQAVVKIRELPCIEGHLDTLAGIVDGAAKSGQLPPVGELNIPETYT